MKFIVNSDKQHTAHLILTPFCADNENQMIAIKSRLGPLNCYQRQLSEIFEDFTLLNDETIILSDSDLVKFKLLIA